MTTDVDRLREQLHRASEDVTPSPGLVRHVRTGARARLRRRRATGLLAVAAMTAAVVLGVPAAQTWLGPDLPVPAANEPTAPPATLPDPLAGYSYRTGAVSAAPPGRAVALYQHGFGVELMDLPQAVVVAADADVYRRLDLAEDRAGAETQGDPAPMLLSPDGTLVAVGDHSAVRSDVAVVDLRTGGVRRYPVDGARSVLPVAWSPDGQRLAYLGGPEPTDPHSGSRPTGAVTLLDLETGQGRTLPGEAAEGGVAFAPDGTEVAVQHVGGGSAVQVWDVAGGRERTVELPPGHRLGGADAWSPDGALLATSHGVDGVSFADASGRGGDVPPTLAPGDRGQGRVLGWASPEEVYVLGDDPGGDPSGPDRWWVTRVALDGSGTERLTSVPTSGGSYGVGRFQLASALLPDLRVRPAGDVDRGPWPPLLVSAAALLVLAAVGLLRYAWGRVRRPGA